MILNQAQQYAPGMLGGAVPQNPPLGQMGFAQSMFPPRDIQPAPNPTYATHAAQGLNNNPWQIETTLMHPGRRREFHADLRAQGLSQPEYTAASAQYRADKDAWRAQEQRNMESMIQANRGGSGWAPNRPAPVFYDPRAEARARMYGGQGMPGDSRSLMNAGLLGGRGKIV